MRRTVGPMRRQPAELSGWHPEEIKAAIRMMGTSVEALSVKKGKAKSYLRAALVRRLYPAEQIIAEFLGIHPMQIWPDRYDAKGNPLHRGRAPAKRRRPTLRVVRS